MALEAAHNVFFFFKVSTVVSAIRKNKLINESFGLPAKHFHREKCLL